MIVLLTDKNILQILDFFKKLQICDNDIIELYDVNNIEKNYLPFPFFNIFKKDIEREDIKSFKFYQQHQFDSCPSQSIIKIIKINSSINLQEFKEFYYNNTSIIKNYKLFYLSLIINYVFDKNNSYEEDILCKYLAEELFFNIDSHPKIHTLLHTINSYKKERKGNSLKNYNEYHTKIKHLLKFLVIEKNKLIISNINVYPKIIKNVNIVCKRFIIGKNLLRFIINSLECGVNIIFNDSEEEKDEIQYFYSLCIDKNYISSANLLPDFPIEYICDSKFNELLFKQYDYIKNNVHLSYKINEEFLNNYKNLMNPKNIKIYNTGYKIYENILDYKNKEELIYIKSLSFSEGSMDFNRLTDGVSYD